MLGMKMSRSASLVVMMSVLFALAAPLIVYLWATDAKIAISGHGYLAIALGALLTSLIGGGLLALSFHSAKHGYDDAVDSAQRPGDDV